jgi:hypothetical protein
VRIADDTIIDFTLGSNPSQKSRLAGVACRRGSQLIQH